MGFGAATTAASTAAASVLPQERLGKGIGYHGLGQAIAMSIGPAFALYLVGTDPSTNLYVGLALVGFAGLVIALNARYESKWQTLPSSSAYRIKMETRLELDSKDGQAPSSTTVTTSETINSEKYPEGDQVSKRTLRDSFNIFEPRALPGAIPQMIMCPTFGFGVFFAGLYGTTLGYTHAGLFYTISAVSMIIIRMISKHFMDTVPAIKTMTGAVACGILCCLMLLAAPYGEPVFLASGIFYGLATGISLPLNQSVAVKNTPPERWGAANALFLLANDIGIGFASVIWGVINDSFGFQTSIVCVIVCLIASYASAWIVYPARDKRWRH
ncbi:MULTISPECIES: MFS transporter [Bifidobacterium]|uniref:MFS transporter n=1 Tax=Bifidobacterium TaxID=1678 RepID=UPI001F622C9F|nr:MULTISPECIES: MFS transporter [Bifidobacterium]MDR3913639.1 MFS transporter [Bifidobacterium sp.]MEE0214398.1 MFS transporter [Bifidobacterium longum]